MTNEELENKLGTLIRSERNSTVEILGLIQEAEVRKIHLTRGHSSSFDWLVRRYGYSQSGAYRRIQASRLLKCLPEISSKLTAGNLNLTHLACLQSAIARVEKINAVKVTNELKLKILGELENTSTDQAQRTVLEYFPDSRTPKESLKATSSDESRLSIILDKEGRKFLERVKELESHSRPDATWAELIVLVLDDFLDRYDPLRKMTHPVTGPVNHCVIPENTRRLILQRAGGQCEFTDEQTSHRCECRHQIEIDHIVPKAMGGGNEPENLRALCRPHNLYEAERVLGFRYQPKEHINGL